MFFKNIRLFRLHDTSVIEGLRMPGQFEGYESRQLEGIQSKHMGWISPDGSHGARLVVEVAGHMLLSALMQEKILPSCVVNDEVAERVEAIEIVEGRPLRRRERLTAREQVYEELLPRAFVRRKRVDMWIDIAAGLIAVNCTTAVMAERMLDLLRQTLGSLKVTPLAVAVPPTQVMTTWLKSGEIPEGVALGESATLSAPGGEDGTMSVKAFDLRGEEVSIALDHGRLVTVLEMGIEGVASFKLHDDMTIKRLSFADAVVDEAHAADDDEDATVRTATDFAIMAQAMAPAIQQLIGYMGGEAQPATTTTEGE